MIEHFFKTAEIIVWSVAIGSYTAIIFILGRAWEYASPTKKKKERL